MQDFSIKLTLYPTGSDLLKKGKYCLIICSLFADLNNHCA